MAHELRSYLLWLLSRRDYSRYQLERKLKLRGLAPEEAAALLDTLVEEGYFREDAFTAAKTRGLLRKGYGPNLLRAKLRAHRVTPSAEHIAKGYEHLGISSADQIRELIQKALRKIKRGKRDIAGRELMNAVLKTVLAKGHAMAEIRPLLKEELAKDRPEAPAD